MRRDLLQRFAATIAVAVTLAASACRPAADPELVFWAMGQEAAAAEAMLDGFRATRPGLAVRVQAIPWSAAHEKLLTAHVGGSMPDVFQLGNTWIAELVALGAAEPLDARMEGSPSMPRDDWFAGALEPNLVAGRLFAVPWYVDTRVLFYRSDLFAEAGVTDAPKTWGDWRAAMTKLRANAQGSPPGRHAIFLPVDEWQTPVILALQQGATLLRDGDRYGHFRSDAVRRGFDFYVSLFHDGLAPRQSQAQVANLYREFASGYFASFVTGPWNLGEIARRVPDLAGRWATAPMPAPDGDSAPGVSVAGGASLAVAATSARKDDAFALVEYLSAAERQQDLRRRTGNLPSRRSAWQAGQVEPNAAAFRTQLEHLAHPPRVPEWERIAAKITLHLERSVRGDEPLDEALAALDRDVDAILEKRRALIELEALGNRASLAGRSVVR